MLPVDLVSLPERNGLIAVLQRGVGLAKQLSCQTPCAGLRQSIQLLGKPHYAGIPRVPAQLLSLLRLCEKLHSTCEQRLQHFCFLPTDVSTC